MTNLEYFLSVWSIVNICIYVILIEFQYDTNINLINILFRYVIGLIILAIDYIYKIHSEDDLMFYSYYLTIMINTMISFENYVLVNQISDNIMNCSSP